MKLQPILLITVLLMTCSGGLLAQEAAEADKSVDQQATTVKDSSDAGEAAGIADKVVAYYFHGTRRCSNCRKIEAYSREAIEKGFVKELESGKLEWHVINTDEPENKHYREDYKLYTKSLIITRVVGEKETEWKNLEKVWLLLNDQKGFIKYVEDEVRAYMGET
ncbi:MAG: nitrophenyl compound nitroreductase subunit ArsF family protein [candidate division Zixibacteria bacterium]|nr:nitrophenyl compound nitroreductase subunit ArsF family protein [candidate division Zixibacteria bacterium]